jgi:hypothetical protein
VNSVRILEKIARAESFKVKNSVRLKETISLVVISSAIMITWSIDFKDVSERLAVAAWPSLP